MLHLLKISRQILSPLFHTIFFYLVLTLFLPLASAQNLELLGQYEISTDFSNLCVAGDYLYGVTFGSKFLTMNISNPTLPVLLATLDIPQPADIAVQEDIAVTGGEFNLTFINVSNPESTFIISSLNFDGEIRTLSIQGDFVYAFESRFPNGFTGLRVIDKSDPYNPYIVGSCPVWGIPFDAGISGHYVFEADYGWHLRTIDIANPANPTQMDSCETPGFSHAIAVSYKYAYIADGYGGLQIIDISNPMHPVIAGSYDTSHHARNIAVWYNYVFLLEESSNYWTLDVIDVSNPITPVLVTGFPHVGRYIFVDNYNIFIGGGHLLQILHFSPTSVEDNHTYPVNSALLKNYPNPFNTSTSIYYSILNPGHVELSIYNILGQSVTRLINDYQVPGDYVVNWNTNGLSSGCYFAKLESEQNVNFVKMELVK